MRRWPGHNHNRIESNVSILHWHLHLTCLIFWKKSQKMRTFFLTKFSVLNMIMEKDLNKNTWMIWKQFKQIYSNSSAVAALALGDKSDKRVIDDVSSLFHSIGDRLEHNKRISHWHQSCCGAEFQLHNALLIIICLFTFRKCWLNILICIMKPTVTKIT